MALVATLVVVAGVVGVLSATAGAATCPGSNFDMFTGGTGGNWNVPGNWSLGAAPSGTEVACWSVGTTVIVSDAESVDSIQADGDLMITTGGSDLTLTSGSNNSAVGNLEIDGGGTLNGGGQSLSASGTFTWGGGIAGAATINSTVLTANAVTMDNTSTPTLASGSISTGSAVTLGANLTVSGTTAFTTSSTITAAAAVAGTGATFTAAGVDAGPTNYGFGGNALVLTGGTTTVASGNTLSTGPLTVQGGTLHNDGIISVTGNYSQTGGTLALDISGTTTGGFGTLQASGSASLGGNLSLTDTGGFTPAQSNTFPFLTSNGRTGSFTLTGPNAGTYVAQYGTNGVTLTVPPPANCPASNFDAYSTAGGNWNVAGNWSLGAPPTGTEVACWATGTSVTVSGAESADSIQGGDLVVTAGGAFTLSAPTATTSAVGSLSLTGGTMTVNSGNTLNAGSVSISSGTLQDDGRVNPASMALTGGTLDGTGTVGGAVTNTSGTVSPGDPPGTGTLTITGAYSQGSGGTLAIELNSTAVGGFSELAVGGAAKPGGTLSLTGSYAPTQGGKFKVLTYGSLSSGTFTLASAHASAYAPQYGSTSLTLLVAPATCPSTGSFDLFTPSSGTTGSWSTAADWSTGALPTSGEAACWAAGTNVTVNGPSDTAGSISGGDLTIASGGTLTLTSAGTSSVDNLALQGGGTLNGPSSQTLTVRTSFAWGASGSGNRKPQRRVRQGPGDHQRPGDDRAVPRCSAAGRSRRRARSPSAPA